MDADKISSIQHIMHTLDKVCANAVSSSVSNVQLIYERACALLNEAAVEYYDGKDSGIGDTDYDHYISTLSMLESSGIVSRSLMSPTQKVNTGSSAAVVKHKVPMLSLKDVFNYEDLAKWYTKMPEESIVSVEPKIDGLSIELWYKDGKLVRGVTRGDGLAGEDVTDKVLAIKTIPNEIDFSDLLVVRGEVYLSRKNFLKYREEVDKSAKNPRNSAVGMLKRKDNGNAAGTYLDAWIFNVQYADVGAFRWVSHEGSLSWLGRLGFHTIPRKVASTIDEVREAIEYYLSIRPDLPFQIDGAVVKLDNLVERDTQGDNNVTPNWAVAFKYPPEEAKTKVLRIDFQLGKSGKITPVAILEPVDVDGSTVSRCTLHNLNKMRELDVRVGDIVTLYKAGDIIPKIRTTEHTADSEDFYYPETCPVCGKPLAGEVCENIDCSAKIENRLHFWVSKDGLNIKTVGGTLVDQLIGAGVLKTPADYYKLNPSILYKLPKMGTAKVRKILYAIDLSRKSMFPEVLTAMSIDGIGWGAATKVTTHIHTWDALLSMSRAQCVEYLGQSAGEKLFTALQSEYYQNLIQELKTIFEY